MRKNLLASRMSIDVAFAGAAYLRRKGSRFLCFMLEKWPEEALGVSRPLIINQIRKAMVDSDANVRRECRSTFGAFVRLW